jgi:hypothetical protein
MVKEESIDRTLVHVSFGLRGDNLTISEVTQALGIEPSSFTVKGTPMGGRSGSAPHPYTVWRLQSKSHVATENLADHVKYILERLEPAVARIEEYRNDESIRVSIGIWWAPEGGQGGYTLSSDLLMRLCALCDEIDFYFA